MLSNGTLGNALRAPPPHAMSPPTTPSSLRATPHGLATSPVLALRSRGPWGAHHVRHRPTPHPPHATPPQQTNSPTPPQPCVPSGARDETVLEILG